MVSPDRPTELGPHSSNLPAVGRRGLDYGGFFICSVSFYEVTRMKDQSKTKTQLIEELETLRKQVLRS